MKFLLILLLLLSLASKACDVSTLESLKNCVSGLDSDSQNYRTYLPVALLQFDRRLEGMFQGVSFLKENSNLLEDLNTKAESGKLSEHLVSNAVEGCQAYRASFQSYVKTASLFIVFFLLTNITLIFYGVYGMRALSRAHVEALPEKADKPRYRKSR